MKTAFNAHLGIHPRTIGFFSPAGVITDPVRLIQAQQYFELLGHTVQAMPHMLGRHQRFAGTDAERLQDLYAVCENLDIDFALATRGGYGLSRLLPQIDFPRLAAALQGRALVGHSDLNTLQLALYTRTHTASWCGPMASFDFGDESVDAFMAAQFWQAMQTGAVSFSFPLAVSDAASVQAQSVWQGTLWGGNLAVLCSLLGTPWMPTVRNGILFLEDINEHPYRVERMLLQLAYAGVLDQQQLILLGDFSGYRLADFDAGYDLAAAVRALRAVIKTPILTGLPFGHVAAKACLPIGGQAKVACAENTVVVQARLSL